MKERKEKEGKKEGSMNWRAGSYIDCSKFGSVCVTAPGLNVREIPPTSEPA